jgi:hypothetical protein
MSKHKLASIAVTGVVAAGVLLGGFSAYAKKDATYIGSAECKACHESTHEALTAAYIKSAHHKAMTDVALNPQAVVAKFDENSPVKKADIKYVLGTGQSYQNYLDKDLKLLPGTWDVKKQAWVKIDSANGATQCVGCHTTNFKPAAKSWTELGVGCESCHGPGSDHAESMDAADINGLKKMDAKHKTMLCGQCHSVGTDPTGTYAFPVGYKPGEELDQKFKLKADVPDGTQNSEYNQFITSKHAQGGMDCTTCHDPHGLSRLGLSAQQDDARQNRRDRGQVRCRPAAGAAALKTSQAGL